jgi:hypothetical protein
MEYPHLNFATSVGTVTQCSMNLVDSPIVRGNLKLPFSRSVEWMSLFEIVTTSISKFYRARHLPMGLHKKGDVYMQKPISCDI